MHDIDTKSHSTFKSRLMENLIKVFGKEPLFLTDSQLLINWLNTEGFSSTSFDEANNLSSNQRKNVILMPTDESSIPSYNEMNKQFKSSRVLVLPLISFSPNYLDAIYTLKLLAQSDFEKSIENNEYWLNLLLSRKDPLTLEGEGSLLTCGLGDDVHVMRPKTEVRLLPGEWDSVGSYFEVGMVPDPEEFRPGFNVNGTLTVPGVAVAHHRQMHEDLHPLHSRAWELFSELHTNDLFPLKVTIKDSHVKQVLAGDKDISNELEELTNKRRELVLTEMAFSTNPGIVPSNIDWTINSQLNEGAIGIHVGIGDGLTGAHIDLICPGVKLTN